MSDVVVVVIGFGHDGQGFFRESSAVAKGRQLPGADLVVERLPDGIAQEKAVVIAVDKDLAGERRGDLAVFTVKRRMIDLEGQCFSLATGDVQDVAELNAQPGRNLDRSLQKPRQLIAVPIERFINPKCLHLAF